MEQQTPHPAYAPRPGMFDGASPKLTFWFGFAGGFALAAIVGMAFFFISGSSLSKAKTSDTTTAAAAGTNTAAAAPTYGNVKAVSDSDLVRGDKNAKLTLVEFSDLECPYCKQFHPTMKQLLSDYAGKVKWVYRNFPLSFHQNAEKEAEAQLCVGKLGGQNKQWDFIDKIYERTTSNGTGFALDALGPLAKEVGVNQTQFQKCLDSGEMAATVSAEEADGTSGGVSGTPTTLLVGPDGKTIDAIPGAYPAAQAKTYIDNALAKIQ